MKVWVKRGSTELPNPEPPLDLLLTFQDTKKNWKSHLSSQLTFFINL